MLQDVLDDCLSVCIDPFWGPSFQQGEQFLFGGVKEMEMETLEFSSREHYCV